MSEHDTGGQAGDPRDSGGGDPRQGVHGSGGYGDPDQDAETSAEDPSAAAADAPVADEGLSPAEQEPGQIGGA